MPPEVLPALRCLLPQFPTASLRDCWQSHLPVHSGAVDTLAQTDRKETSQRKEKLNAEIFLPWPDRLRRIVSSHGPQMTRGLREYHSHRVWHTVSLWRHFCLPLLHWKLQQGLRRERKRKSHSDSAGSPWASYFSALDVTSPLPVSPRPCKSDSLQP